MVPRVKVLKFVTAFAVGGTERQFVHVTRGLDRSRFDIQIGCFRRSGPFLNEISALDIPISEYPTTSFYSYEAVRAQLRLAQTIRRERVQLVHAYGSYPNLFTVPAARLARNCVSIASLRDLGLFSGGNKLKGAAQKLAFSFADCVLANSNAARNWLLNQGVKQERVHVIPNGINVARFKPAPDDCDFPIRREFNIDPKAPLVTLVCRTDRNKGLEGFMDVVPIVANRFPDVRFMLVGGSPCNPCYEIDIRNLAARRNLNNRLIFTGERSDVPAVLQESTLSVLPSLSESFSNGNRPGRRNGTPRSTARSRRHGGCNHSGLGSSRNGETIRRSRPRACHEALFPRNGHTTDQRTLHDAARTSRFCEELCARFTGYINVRMPSINGKFRCCPK